MAQLTQLRVEVNRLEAQLAQLQSRVEATAAAAPLGTQPTPIVPTTPLQCRLRIRAVVNNRHRGYRFPPPSHHPPSAEDGQRLPTRLSNFPWALTNDLLAYLSFDDHLGLAAAHLDCDLSRHCKDLRPLILRHWAFTSSVDFLSLGDIEAAEVADPAVTFGADPALASALFAWDLQGLAARIRHSPLFRLSRLTRAPLPAILPPAFNPPEPPPLPPPP